MISRIRIVLLLLCLSLLTGCAATMTRQDPALTMQPTGFTAPVSHLPGTGDTGLDDKDLASLLDVYDPWEPLNRNIYSFNAHLDRYLLLPAVSVYEAVLPSPVREGVSNVIDNLNEFSTFVNCLLQGDGNRMFVTLGRTILNTTFGVVGVFDVATPLGIKRVDADFGQTLGVYGVPTGPYFVIPVLGPSNVRDAVGEGVDLGLAWIEMKKIYDWLDVQDRTATGIAELTVRTINKRANIAFRYYETGTPFEYEMVRFLYTQKRKMDVARSGTSLHIKRAKTEQQAGKTAPTALPKSGEAAAE